MIDGLKPIKPLRKMSYPHELIFFDTESTIHNLLDHFEKHSFKLGCAIYIQLDKDCNISETSTYHFDTVPQFWHYVELHCKKDKKLYILAHNVKYDLVNVDGLKQLELLGFDVPYPVMNNAFILTAKKGRHSLKILDTFNYMRTSVREMGKSVGIEKMEVDFYLSTLEQLKSYCENDVKIIQEWTCKFIKRLHDNKLGSFKNTSAGTAFDIYRHSFIDTPIYYHDNKTVLELERDSYRGGMVECYQLYNLTKGKYYLLDVNSMYPYVMSHKKLPVYPSAIIDNPVMRFFMEHVKNAYVIADCLIKVTPLSMRRYGIKFKDEKENKRLIFPSGTFRTTLHNPEILKALENGELLEVYHYVLYKPEYCLKSYSDYFYQMKQTADNKADYEIAKLLMNSLYGRFALRKYINDVIDFSSIPDMSDFQPDYYLDTDEKGKHSIFYKWGESVFIHSYAVENELVKNTNVALAGAVTAYARMVLCDYIELAGVRNVFYTDTDSLVVNEEGYQNLKGYLDNKKLGFLKLEMTFNRGRINAPKDYHFTQTIDLSIKRVYALQNKNLHIGYHGIIAKRRIRSKGIPLNAVNHDGIYLFWQFTTFKDYLRTGKLGRKEVSKKNSYNYHKGEVNKSGNVQGYQLIYENGENKKL